MATIEELNQSNFNDTVERVKKLPAETANQVWNNAVFTRSGGVGGESTPLNEMKWLPANFRDVKQLLASLLASQEAQTKAFLGAIAALNKGESFDQTKLVASIQEATTAGVMAALEGLAVTGEVTNLKVEVGGGNVD